MLPRHSVIYDRRGVIPANHAADGGLVCRAQFPRRMDKFVRYFGQFRHIAADEAPLWVEFLGLGDRVENPEPRLGVAAAARAAQMHQDALYLIAAGVAVPDDTPTP